MMRPLLINCTEERATARLHRSARTGVLRRVRGIAEYSRDLRARSAADQPGNRAARPLG